MSELETKMMAAAALDGYPEGMRAIDTTGPDGSGFDIVCPGDSPRFWFRGPDEKGMYEWLRERAAVRKAKGTGRYIPSMRWADVEVADAAIGFTLRTTDGGAVVHVYETGAAALQEWLRIKLGGVASDDAIPPVGPPVVDIAYGGELDARRPNDSGTVPLQPLRLDNGILLQDDTELGVSFRLPTNNDCICFFTHLGEIELMKYLEYVLVNPAPHVERKFGELTVRPFEPGGLDIISHDGRELVHLPEGQLRDIKAWLERKLAPRAAGTDLPFEGAGECPASKDAPAPDDQLEREHGGILMRVRDLLEREHGGILMRVRDLPELYSELKSWIGAKYGTHNILAVLSSDRLRLRWYTRDSQISVSVRLPGQNGSARGYLGATASSRAPRPGETWTRGNDLADGPYSHETWLKIVADVAFWDALPLRIPMTGENDAHNQSGYPADHPYVIPVRPEIPNGDKAPIKLSPRDEALDVVRAVVNVPENMMLDEVVGGVVDAAYVKHAQAHAGKLPAGVDPRVVTDTPFFSAVDPITYQACVDIGGDTFSVSMVCTPKFESTVDGIRGMDMRAAIDRAVGDYVEELANLNQAGASDGATRPMIKLVVEATSIWWMVYGFNLKKMVPKSGVE